MLDRREDDGRVWKCTLCYDRLLDDKEPACAQACPTNSIQFGELGDLRERAHHRIAGQREEYLIKALHDYKSGQRSGGAGAAMAEVAYPLSNEEITALAHYLAHL